MNVDQYVAAVAVGEVKAGHGVVSGGEIASAVRHLRIDADINDLTAEAFNQDVFGEDDKWDDAVEQVRMAIAELEREPKGG